MDINIRVYRDNPVYIDSTTFYENLINPIFEENLFEAMLGLIPRHGIACRTDSR